MKRILTLSVLAAAVLATGCTRIETGEVGLRVGFDRQVKTEELLPGSFNQVIIGDVITFPTKEITVKVEDMTPLAKDNSTMKDFDAMITYNLNQAQVAEIYNSKNKSFHAKHDGDVYLMYNYVFLTISCFSSYAAQFSSCVCGSVQQILAHFCSLAISCFE